MRHKTNLSVADMTAEIEKIDRRLYSQGDYPAVHSERRERLLFRRARLENDRNVAIMRERRERK